MRGEKNIHVPASACLVNKETNPYFHVLSYLLILIVLILTLIIDSLIAIMEPTEEVLVVIQAESGEEIALPLAALDEQHQEVVVESNGTTTPTSTINDNNNLNGDNIDTHKNDNDNHIPTGNEQQTQDPHNKDVGHSQSESSMTPTTDTTPIEIRPPSPRQKQKRKEKLVCLPLNEEDLKLEFQFIEEPSPHPQVESVKRKPRKEYRTKKKMAMEAARASESGDNKNAKTDLNDTTTTITDDKVSDDSIKTNHNDSHNKSLKGRRKSAAKEHKSSEIVPETGDKAGEDNNSGSQTTPKSKLKSPQRHLNKQSKESNEELEELNLPEPQNLQEPQNQPTERRTRLSNSCRVATGKSYKCHDCGYSTERINNISLHIKRTCPKLYAK